MHEQRHPPSPPTDRSTVRLLGVLCAAYVVLLFYASLMPFDFAIDPARTDAQLSRVWQYWPFGELRTSRADMLSNVVLYVPLGLLLTTRLTLREKPLRWLAFAGGVVVCVSVSLLIECVQVFSLSRVASATDLLMNSCGGTLGATAGALLGARCWLRLSDGIRTLGTGRPLALAAGLMIVLLAADALYPLRPTLDRSTLSRNVRNSAFSLKEGLERHTGHHWLVRRFGVYAVLTVLLGAAGRRSRRVKWLWAALAVTGFAAVTEFGKIFVESRTANIANIVMAGTGALFGMFCGLLLSRRLSSVTKKTVAAVLLSAYILYVAWTPFNFAWDSSAFGRKMPRGATWLPLYHYAMGSPHKAVNAVRLFVRTLVLVGALTCAVGVRWPKLFRKVGAGRLLLTAFAAGLLGLALECGQFLLPERIPSTTDVFCFALGGILGVWVWRTYPSESAAYENALHAESDSTST